MPKFYEVVCRRDGRLDRYTTREQADAAARAHEASNGSGHETTWRPAMDVFSVRSADLTGLLKDLRYPNFPKLDALKADYPWETEDSADDGNFYYIFCKTHGYRDIFLTLAEAESAKAQHDRQCMATCDWGVQFGSKTAASEGDSDS
ncbi:hypothetical protein [Lewinella sp. IMCC34183]|uniref:hypothetical protein n=1 Tax=Lewinella sp. IMCC34183 TaxID=2248762 RepID=UPI0013009346|nr:hypothetical protein [Lewinella sp. IMCC34183]